jgi:hypothetical protein
MGKVANIIGSGLGLWRSRVIFILNVSFLFKLLFPFPIDTAKLLGYYFYIICEMQGESLVRFPFLNS